MLVDDTEGGREDAPDPRVLLSLLKVCGAETDLERGCRIHATIAEKRLLLKDAFLGSALVSMYAKCGSIAKARDVLYALPVRDVVSWTALMVGYVACGHPKEAMACLQQMKQECVYPDAFAYASGLKACTILRAFGQGRKMHEEISWRGLESHSLIGNTLISMYSKSGSVQKAEELFEKLEARTTVSWTALIVGYADNGYPEEALLCLDRMQREEGISADAPLYMCSLKACGCVGALGKGQEIHVEICKSGFERDMQISSSLVDMYAKNGSLAEASCLFRKHRDGDVVLWTSLIAGYAEHEQSEEALWLFAQMQHCAISPDSVTFSFALKACGTMGAHGKGRQIHAIVAIRGMESDLLFGNSLIDMYVKCGMIANAHEALHELSARDVASWTALMVGFVEHDLNREALDCFEKMQDDGISPDEVAYSCALKACESSRTISKAAELHCEVVVKGYEEDLAIASTLLGIYVRHGLLVEALGVFDSLQARNVVLWNALIGGFVEHGLSENALDCLPKMQREGVSPHLVTFLCVLKACGSLGATDLGKELHSDVMERGFEADLTIGNTLVDLYAKCGMLLEAKDVFEKLPDQDEVSWNTLLVGYSQIGESELVFNFFKRMLGSGWKPNTVALVSILNVCNHAGKLDEGHLYFGAMCYEYGMIPTPEHHTCLVDLLGRAGLVDSAMLVIKEMPYHPSVTPWHTILGACRKWGNVELGIHAFEEAIGLRDTDVSAYISMGNIFADAEMRIPGLC